MGSAAPIIGLATQGLGLIAGGGSKTQTVMQPDPRAKYEADYALFQRAEENAKLAEEILRGQVRTQEGFAKFQYDQQNYATNMEQEVAMNQLETQFAMGMFNQQIQRMTNEAERYQQLTNYRLQREQANFEREQALSRLGIRAEDLELAERGITANRAGAQAGFDLAKQQTDSARRELALGAEQDKQALKWANKEFDIREAGLMDARTNLKYKEQGIDLAQIQSDATYSQELQALNTQESKNDIEAQIAKANAEQVRKEALRNLSLQLASGEREAEVLYNEMTGRGFRNNPQMQAIQAQIINNDASKAGKRSLMERYGMQMGLAGLQQSMGQADISRGKRGLEQNKRIGDQKLDVARGELEPAYGEVDRSQAQIGFGREQSLQQFNNAEAAREIQANNLAAQEQYDILSKSLIPNEQYDQAQMQVDLQRQQAMLDSQAVNQNYATQMQGLDASRMGYDINQGIAETQMGLQEKAMLPEYQSGLRSLINQGAMNRQSNIANYQAQMGAAQQAQSAGLNQIAAQQHGLLSQLGGVQQAPPLPPNQGGGINWGGIGKFGQGLFSVLGGMGAFGGGGGGVSYSPNDWIDTSRISAPAQNTSLGYNPYHSQIPAPYMGRK